MKSTVLRPSRVGWAITSYVIISITVVIISTIIISSSTTTTTTTTTTTIKIPSAFARCCPTAAAAPGRDSGI